MAELSVSTSGSITLVNRDRLTNLLNPLGIACGLEHVCIGMQDSNSRKASGADYGRVPVSAKFAIARWLGSPNDMPHRVDDTVVPLT